MKFLNQIRNNIIKLTIKFKITYQIISIQIQLIHSQL